jgi:sn-glycerol 3-phosphate transport system permease protein
VTSPNPLLRWLTILFLATVAVVEVFPYLWMMSTSLKDLQSVTQFPPSLFPDPPRWDNYAKAWSSGPFLRYAVNNAIQTIGILVFQLFFGCLAAYGFSKLRFPGRDVAFLIVIACLIVPPQVRFIPLYMLFSKVGLLNTYASLILPYAVSALGTFLIREAFMQISDDIDAPGGRHRRALAHHHGGQYVRRGASPRRVRRHPEAHHPGVHVHVAQVASF